MELNEWLTERHGPLMDLEDLAQLLRLQKTTLYQQIYKGRLDIPHFRRGKKYLFPTAEVAKYVQNQVQN